VYATDIGEQPHGAAADGSTVELNASLRITVTLSKDVARHGARPGPALFHVAKDARGPSSSKAKASRYGPSARNSMFYRNEWNHGPRCWKGGCCRASARFAHGTGRGLRRSILGSRSDEAAGTNGATILVSAGEQVTVTPHEVPKAPQGRCQPLRPRGQQRLIFEATPLSDVADEFNRYNTRRLVIADLALRSVASAACTPPRIRRPWSGSYAPSPTCRWPRRMRNPRDRGEKR